MTLTEYTTSQIQKARLRKALDAQRGDLLPAHRAALTHNDSIRWLCDSEAKATRPLTLEEWRRVKPSVLRRLWKRLTNLSDAIGARVGE